ncbi:MAG: hypothetical protein IPO32_00820 [Crocinitomicaceae bacterium]|nr:hypothetical protein [Crocinitomicaceae bacterium]
MLLIPIGFQQIQTGISFRNIKLNVKIQIGMICLIMLTLVAFGIGAVSFVEEQYQENNVRLIKRKMGSVKMELEGKLKEEKVLRTELADYLEFLLKKFSGIFATDINVFTLRRFSCFFTTKTTPKELSRER